MTRLASGLAALLLAASALLIPAASASAAPADDIFSLLNQARVTNGQDALARNAALDEVAAAWAQQLAASGVLAHNPDYSAQIPAGWSRAGENVARGQVDANQMHTEWMASPGHRANILGDYTDVGVAFLEAGGTTWGVQVFANYPVAATAAPAESVPELETLALPESGQTAASEPAATPAIDAAAKVTTVSDAPFGAVRAEQPGWSPLGLAAGGLLVALAAASTAVRRRHLPER